MDQRKKQMEAAQVTAEQMTLEIDGMHCDACVRRVTQALTRAGAATIQAVAIGTAELEARSADAPTLLAALEKAGFPARVRSSS